jgi:hypothetical protein
MGSTTVKTLPTALAAFPVAVLMLTVAPMAMAQTLNGTYELVFVQDCQATFSYTPDPSPPNNVSSLNTVDNGKLSGTIGTAVFNSTKHTVTITGWQDQGSLLMIEGIKGATVMKDATFSQKLTFATGAGTLSLTSTTKPISTLDFSAVYGSLDGDVAGSVDFLLSAGFNGCSIHGSARLQTD